MNITIFVILKCENSMYVDAFTDKVEAEGYIHDHPDCCVRHVVRFVPYKSEVIAALNRAEEDKRPISEMGQ